MRRFFAVLIVVLTSTASHAQTSIVACYPPYVPPLSPSATLMADYENEIRQEFNQYFDDAQTYLRCLEEQNEAAQQQVRDVLTAYEAIFTR